MMFAALSGSSPATVVAIGTIVIAGMREVGYTKEFAAGVICNAGTLGILIPPSIVMVVYAAATDVSVGRMFLAGVIPGLIAGLMLMVGILYCGQMERPAVTALCAGWREIASSGKDAFWGLVPHYHYSGRHLWWCLYPYRSSCRRRCIRLPDCQFCLS